MPARDNHSSLLQTFVSYNCKKSHNVGPLSLHYHFFNVIDSVTKEVDVPVLHLHPSLIFVWKVRLIVAKGDTPINLLRCIINYARKKFNSTCPGKYQFD